jgi:hypothetical protein
MPKSSAGFLLPKFFDKLSNLGYFIKSVEPDFRKIVGHSYGDCWGKR